MARVSHLLLLLADAKSDQCALACAVRMNNMYLVTLGRGGRLGSLSNAVLYTYIDGKKQHFIAFL